MRRWIVGTTIICSLGFAFYVWPKIYGRSNPVLLVDNGSPNTVSVHLVFPRGTESGPVAHYTEHLAWLPNIGLLKREAGSHSNAWTTELAIGYWLSGPPESLATMLGKLSDVFKPITLPRDFADQERSIILREYDLRFGNSLGARADEDMRKFLYTGNALGASVIGTKEQIRAVTYEEAKVAHAAIHQPKRARLVVTGSVSDEVLAAALKKADFPDLSANHEVPKPTSLSIPDSNVEIFRYSDATAAPKMIWRKVVNLPKPIDFDLLDLRAGLTRDILNTNLPGGLAGPLRFDKFVAKSFFVGVVPLDESHIELVFEAEPDKGVSFAELRAAFEAALASSGAGVPTKTFERVVNRFDGFGPDWAKDDEAERFMANYAVERISNLRDPSPMTALRKLEQNLAQKDIDTLLAALAGSGRIAIAFIGKDSTP